MAGLDVTVHIPKLGNPDFSFTEKQLKAWELVTFSIGQGGSRIAPLNFAQIGGCNYVQDCGISVHVDFTYRVARELQEHITDAATAGNTALANIHTNILLRVKWHAGNHYERVVNSVIPAWESDLQKELAKTLPTDHAPTSLQESEIQARIAELVAYWVGELGYRMARDVNDWERADYPQLSTFMRSPQIGGWMPLDFPVPKFREKQPSRPKITFPRCQPQ